MNFTVSPIVEGHGEEAAFPVLLRRICSWATPEVYVNVSPPIRVRKDKFLNRDGDFEKYLRLADAKSDGTGWIMVLLDADDDCPVNLGNAIRKKAEYYLPDKLISVVVANREYEAWFIAGANSLDGVRGFRFCAGTKVEAEGPRNAKGWMGDRMDCGRYGEVLDQSAFSAKLDLQQAHDGSRFFRKLVSEWRHKIKELEMRAVDFNGVD